METRRCVFEAQKHSEAYEAWKLGKLNFEWKMLENAHILVIFAVLKLWSVDPYDQSPNGSAWKFFGGLNNFAKAFQMTNSI